MKAIGPTFSSELNAAGVNPNGFSWGTDGSILFNDAVPQATRDAVAAVYAAHDPTKQLVVPDVAGFITEAKAALGGIVMASKIAGAQAVFLALQSGNFADAQALIIDSHAQALLGGLSDAQYAGIKQLAAKHNVPLVLA